MEVLCNMKIQTIFKIQFAPRNVLRNVYLTICWQSYML